MKTRNIKMLTSEPHIAPKFFNADNDREAVTPFIIDGCVVSLSSTPENADNVIQKVKEILLSAYRTKAVRG